FKKNLSMKLSMRKKLNIEKKSIVLTYVGRLNSEKGVLNLLNTFKKIIITKKNVYLLLIGPDEMNIKKMINNNICSKKLIILDYQKNINFFLQASDIFCFPSEREGFGLSVIEASACELPVVCSNIYGLRDTIVHNNTGYKFRLNNNLEMYNYLIRLIQDKNKRIRLGSQGRDFVKNFYEKKKIILAYSIFFKKLIFRNEIK
ncbi:glycosyltransferase, partial [Candidatus Pelagibacter sp.]|nr:glycosyltransferase [Candidatus Pelagibacter sp.]